MGKKGVPSVPVAILLCRSGFGYYFGRDKYDSNGNIQEVISMGIGLMCNNAAVCDGSRVLKLRLVN